MLVVLDKGKHWDHAMTDAVEDILAGMIAGNPPRSRSLIVSVYGDAILPHGGEIWLGGLMRLVAPFGLGERVVRTAVFRLVQDGILASDRRGRKSFYTLTETGRRHFESAQRRIYALAECAWDGSWLLVLAGAGIDGADRAALRRELGWQGFAETAPGVFLHPGGEADLVRATLHGLGLDGRAVLFSARNAEVEGGAGQEVALAALARNAWDLSSIDVQYRQFLERFAPLASAVERADGVQPEAAFVARVLLVHEYRRALLKDPSLPAALLPEGWSGTKATALARGLYLRLAQPAERHLEAVAAEGEGEFAPLAAGFARRFGGLSLDRAAE